MSAELKALGIKMKWDGHTHSQFCRHGSGEETTAFVEKAIKQKFDKYSITEHAPIPSEVIPDLTLRSDFGLTWDEIDDYFTHIEDLKRIYGKDIEILAGLEIDYLVGYESYTEDILSKYRNCLDDVIFSVHFIPGQSRLLPIDYSADSFKTLIDVFGTAELVHLEYWNTIKTLIGNGIAVGLRNKRIGHLGLINKFMKIFPLALPDLRDAAFYGEIFKEIKEKDWMVDFDVAGMDYPHCQETYLPEFMQYWCDFLQIKVVYGSDAHSAEAVGKYYQLYERMNTTKYPNS